MVCARHLANWGARVQVLTTSPSSEFQGVPERQLEILKRMGIPLTNGSDGPSLPAADVIVDAIIGYSLRGAPTGVAASLIRAANLHGAPILSLDVPSGVDTSTGSVNEPATRATATLTLALPKRGLNAQDAIPYVGELYLADIGVPPQLYASAALGLEVRPIFAENEVVRLR